MSWLLRGARLPDRPGKVDVLLAGDRVVRAARRLAAPKDAELVDARGALLLPGLVDLQINGGWGADFGLSSAAEAVRAAERLAAEGVTGFLPTLISAPLPRLEAALGRLAEAARARRGARILGVHLEGPFLSPRRRGAHRAACLRRPSAREFERLWRASRGLLRVITLAPELPGAAAVIAAARRRGVLVSLGHTDGRAEDVERAAAAGARLVTHLFNAMPPLHHRLAGPAGAALLDDRLACGLIYDRSHVERRAAALAMRAKGAGGLFLVSDAVFALGLRPGRYRAAGVSYELRGGAFRVRGGPLGGGVRSLRQCVLLLSKDLGLPLAEAWRLGSESPARLLGLRPPGRVLASPDGTVLASFLGGTRWK